MRVSIARMRTGLLLLAVSGTSLISACYVPRQGAFESSVRQQIQVNMQVIAAQKNLGKLKLSCYRQGSQLDCTRTRASLFPLMSCIERVVLQPAEPAGRVTAIDIRKIVCFGGFG